MKRLIPVGAVVLALTGFAGSGLAHNTVHVAKHRYNVCQHRFRSQHARPCGRNIVEQGWKEKGKPAHPASLKQVARWSRKLRVLVHPVPYLATKGVPPRVPTGNGAASAHYAPTGLASCIVQRESTGNPQASNSSGHSGLAGWSQEAWGRMGGRQYAPTPTQASKQQQLQVLSNGLSHYGCRDWCPYDHC